MLTELSECKTSWWPTPTFVDPSELTIDLERLEREIEKVMGIPAWSRAEDLAAATTRDNDMNSGKAEQKLDTSSRTTPARLTFADVIRAFDDLENRVEEVEGEIDAHLESSLRRKVRAYLRKKFPPAPRSAMTDVGRLEAALLWAKQAGTRVQGLENRLVGLTVTSNADEIQLVRERITKVGTVAGMCVQYAYNLYSEAQGNSGTHQERGKHSGLFIYTQRVPRRLRRPSEGDP